jgi:L-ascorbate metabolism protein UlaG (beta-lactamase superfamily)
MSAVRPRVLQALHWLGHDSFRIDDPVVIYLDPWKLPAGQPQADLILVSHEHHDHCSPDDVQRIRKPGTVVIANPTAAAKLEAPVRVLRPGESTTVGEVGVRAVPAYNLDKEFHPKAAGHVGYVLTLAGESLYFAGDTDHIPEMKGLACDIALLPVSGVYVMTAEEAVRAAADIKPRVAVPMHYGAGVAGTAEDAETFRRLCTVPVVVLSSEGGG